MPTNDFKIFAGGSGANVVTQAGYTALTSLLANGFVAGTANSNEINKVFRQSSLMAAMLGAFINAKAGTDALDDGTITSLLANFEAAVTASSSTSGVSGAYKNLVSSASGTSAAIAISVDEVVVSDSSYKYKTLHGVSVSINSASAGANGLDTGTLATSTWYATWVIYNPTTATVAGLISLSGASPTLPAGYTSKARIGWVRTDGTANKYPLSFRQVGRRANYVVAAGSNVTTYPQMDTGTRASFTGVSVSTFIPTTAARIAVVASGGLNSSVAVSANNAISYSRTSFCAPLASAATGSSSADYPQVSGDLTLETSTIYWAAIAPTSGTNLLSCLGWEDNL